MKNFFLCQVLGVMGLCCFSSCALLLNDEPQKMSILIDIADISEVHRHISLEKKPTWTILWYTAEGQVQKLEHAQNNCRISIEKGSTTPVLAIPDNPIGVLQNASLPIAGAIFPIHADAHFYETKLTLDFSKAVSAQTAQFILSNKRGSFSDAFCIINHFNWLKLDSKMSTQNPLVIDIPKLGKAILSGKVLASDCSSKKSVVKHFDVSLFFNGYQDLDPVFYSPFEKKPIFTLNTENNLVNLSLFEGSNYFFSKTGCFILCLQKNQIQYATYIPYK